MSISDYLKPENFIAASSFFVSIASLIVSIYVYAQDKGKLDFYVGLGEIWGGEPFRLERNVLMFRIVNAGRRPLIISSIGGDLSGEFLVGLLSKFFPSKFRTTSFLLQSREITNATTLNGQPRVLSEGESISFQLPLPEAMEIYKKLATTSSCVYVFDTVGKKHKVPCRAFKGIKNSYKRYAEKIEPK